MNDKPRKQLSLRFDNYADLLEEANKYCEINNVTLTSLVATGLRLVMPSQQARHDKAIENDNRLGNIDDRLAKLEEQLAMTSQVNAIAPDRELIRDEIVERTAYLATAMNEVKSQLENDIEFLKTKVEKLEQNQEEKPTNSPVTAEATKITKEEIRQGDAITTEVTEENVVSATKEMSPKKRKDVANSIQKTLRDRGTEISQPEIIKKVLEMYPNPDNWFRNCAARDEVIEALEKEHK